MRGKFPQDPATKSLHGSPSRRKHEENGDPFVQEAPVKPAFLNARQSAEWDRLGATLKPILSRASEGMLVIAVQSFDQMMQADEIIAAHGLTYRTVTKEGSEMIRQRPEIGIRDRARRQYQQALQELAAGPVSATRVRRLPERKTAAEEKSGSARFFTSGGHHDY
jgi:P27 family predicted phage terminase small subunit